MPRRTRSPSDQVPSGFVLGSTFDHANWQESTLVEDLNGNVSAIVGFMPDKPTIDRPYFAPCVSAKDRHGRSSRRFVELRHGILRMSSFFFDNSYYRTIVDRRIALPSGAQSFFGVETTGPNWREDETLTRKLFGATRQEIEIAARGIARITGRSDGPYARYPRVTFSGKRSNQCDFSGCLIPKDFPYVAFNESQYAWSHISLYGLYRLLLTRRKTT